MWIHVQIKIAPTRGSLLFLRKLVPSDELQALHWRKMGWVTHHVNEKQLGDIPVLEFIIILLEKRSK